MDFREKLIVLLESKGIFSSQTLIEVPPDNKFGDFALPCFTLAKERKKSPAVIAKELASELNADFLEKIEAAGPYVNFYLDKAEFAKAVLELISAGKIWQPQDGKKILIEYPSPNTNKPLHLGHVRNMVLGSTLALVLKADGNEVIQVNLNNDRGVHICKSMLAYRRWGNGAQPDKKSDHYVGDFYVLFAKNAKENPALEKEAQEMLVAWENGNDDVRSLWRLMNGWALDGFRQTYDRFGIGFDKEYYESEIYQEGKDIISEKMSLLVKDETGAIVAPLEKYGLPDKVLLRSDGTSIYMTQDIVLTLKKMQEFNPDMQIWVVANEQNLHFQQLFAIMDLLGFKGKETFCHLSYGMVALPDGRMKSREGNVVDADDLLDEVEAMAAEEIRKRRTEWDSIKISSTAKKVALGAIRFFMIKYDPLKDFVYDPKSSLSFEGDTGPYVQYTHSRICSILSKTEYPGSTGAESLSQPEEQELIRQLSKMPSSFRKAADELKPSAIAVQLLEIARAFNSFYHACPVLGAPEGVKKARVQLVWCTRRVLDEGLALLGIDAPEEM